MDETINITALAVNDNPDQLYLMRRMLGSVGYKVLTAGDGREAFDLLLRERAQAGSTAPTPRPAAGQGA